MGKNAKRTIGIIMILAMCMSCTFICLDRAYAKSTDAYLIKVNRRANVCTAYKKINGEYVPIRAMLVSCGRATKKSNTTPKGTFRLKKKYRWRELYGHTYGQYAARFYKDYLFHTVPYYKKNDSRSMKTSEYRKLGTNASGGCVRMQYIDEKWLYSTCPNGTKVIVYSSTAPGPLGKPKAAKLATKMSYYYDPTQPAAANAGYTAKAPVITVGKDAEVACGSDFDPLQGVAAVDSRTSQDLTGLLKYTAARENDDGTWSTVEKVDTAVPGNYMVIYSCYYKYCSRYSAEKTFRFTVADRAGSD